MEKNNNFKKFLRFLIRLVDFSFVVYYNNVTIKEGLTLFDDIYTDDYGRYIIESSIVENGLTFEWRKYMYSTRIKKLGGAYANVCVEKNMVKFYRNDYIRTKAYPKFVKDNS